MQSFHHAEAANHAPRTRTLSRLRALSTMPHKTALPPSRGVHGHNYPEGIRICLSIQMHSIDLPTSTTTIHQYYDEMLISGCGWLCCQGRGRGKETDPGRINIPTLAGGFDSEGSKPRSVIHDLQSTIHDPRSAIHDPRFMNQES